MSDHHPDPGDHELDERASARLDGEDGEDRVHGKGGDDGVEAAVRARAARFEQVRAELVEIPGPPPGALDGLVAAALSAYDDERAVPPAAGAEPPGPTNADRARRTRRLAPRRAARWLAPVGAAAALLAVLGVAALVGGGRRTGTDAASEALITASGTEQLGSSAGDTHAAAEADERSTGPATLSGAGENAPAAPTSTVLAAGPASSNPPTNLGTYADLADLAAALDRDGAAPGGEAPAPASSPVPAGATDGGTCGAAGALLGSAELAGRVVTVVERPDGSLAAFDAGCTLVEEAPP